MGNNDNQRNGAIEKVESISQRVKERNAVRSAERQVRAEKRERARFAREQNRDIRRESDRKEREFHESERKAEEMRRGANGAKGGVGGWIAAVASLSALVLIFGSMLMYVAFSDENKMRPNSSSATSQRAFYDFVGYVDNIETNMSKFFVSSDKEGRQKILGELSVQSNLADAALSALPLTDENKFYTAKYINQVGDYSKYLNNRLIDGFTLSEDDMEKFGKLHVANVKLKKSLSALSAGLGENYDFDAMLDGSDGDDIVSGFKDLEDNAAADYPEMIYDGPFSDGLEAGEPKGLHGDEIDGERAKKLFGGIFGEYGIEKPELTGDTENGRINCYCVSAKLSEGGELFAQFSKKGGRLVMFTAHRDCGGANIEEDECVGIAERFLISVGLENMRCVWKTSDSSESHLNFAYTENGVIMYPDLVKVNVCRETGRVTGIDADLYYINHVAGRKTAAERSMEEAEEKVSEKLEIVSRATAVIPKGNGNERLAYEFVGRKDGATYYVYIDAATLKESDIFKVVTTEEGVMLL